MRLNTAVTEKALSTTVGDSVGKHFPESGINQGGNRVSANTTSITGVRIMSVACPVSCNCFDVGNALSVRLIVLSEQIAQALSHDPKLLLYA